MLRTYTIFADYFQIALRARRDVEWPIDVTAESCRQFVLPAPGVVMIMTVRNMNVPVTLEVFASEPPLDLAAFDHVVEASLDLGSGTLVISDMHDLTVDEIPVAPGSYRVRFSGAALGSLSVNGLEGEDRYTVNLWPASPAPVVVLKQWEELG